MNFIEKLTQYVIEEKNYRGNELLINNLEQLHDTLLDCKINGERIEDNEELYNHMVGVIAKVAGRLEEEGVISF